MARKYSTSSVKPVFFTEGAKRYCSSCGFSFERVNPETGICNSCKNAQAAA